MTLRQHMKEMHSQLKLPRSNADLMRLHQKQHHQYRLSHFHEGVNLGPGDRPSGWKTGEGAIKIVRK